MTSAKNSNATIVTLNTKRITALKKYITSQKTGIPIAGEQLKPADLIAVYQDDLDTRAAVVSAKAAYESAVATRVDSTQKMQVTDEALRSWVLNSFGPTSAEAKEFGYAPHKKPTMSAEDRASAVNASKATREANASAGTKVKEKNQGAMAPPTAPAAPAVTAAPASTSAPVAAVVNGAATNGAAH